ncbi:MAG: hypothetical protein ACKVN9_07355 [Methylophilaceae bacterium]
MNISTTIPIKPFNFFTNNKKPSNLSAIAQNINSAGDAALAKRKELAVTRMKGLQERLAVMMMFAAIGSKGTAASAAQVAKEIAGTVKDYADASGKSANADAQGVNQADENFLGMARVLSSQVKAIIYFEAASAKYPEKHASEIYQMDTAINSAEKSLHSGHMPNLYSFDGSTLALLQSHFSASA